MAPAARAHHTPLEQILASIRDARFNRGVRCPRCDHTRTQRWGSFRGRQRYRCCQCRRTFSDLTGTAAASVKKLNLWTRYSYCLARGFSVRRSARLLHVSPTTAFRWRHALLTAARERDDVQLGGWVELDWTWFAYSEKGRRRLDRPAKRRGIRIGRQLLTPGTTVAIACDRSNRVVTGLIDEDPAKDRLRDAGRLARVVAARVRRPGALIARTGRFGPAAVLARRLGLTFHDARGHQSSARRARSIVHVRNALAYRNRLHLWIRRFRGVATRYLANYLVWHRAVDGHRRGRLRIELLRWPLDSNFA